MSRWYRDLVRPVLFGFDSEEIHERALGALGWIARRPLFLEATRSWFGAPALPVDLFGLRFPNPVGLAAGMDKFGLAVPVWEALGFGHVELGGITWRAQPGNPRPRLFRVVPEEALINRMGFNNPGAEAFAETLSRWRQSRAWPRHPVGINLGKSRDTPLADAAQDYANSFRVLRAHADFFVVNVSSPNTPNLRQLQNKSALDGILAALQEVQAGLEAPSRKPLLVKVSPDLSFEALDEIVDLVQARSIAGIVATNTTTTRPATSDERVRRLCAEPGGLSGGPLRSRSTEVVRHLFRRAEGRIPIIGVGGIFCAADAWEKITAGAALVQVYTGLIYEGPGLVGGMVSGLQRRLAELGLADLRLAVGLAAQAERPANNIR